MKTPRNSSASLLCCLAITVIVFTIAASLPASAASDKCPAVNAISNFHTSSIVFYSITGPVVDGSNNSTFTYLFQSTNENPTDGVPGLITYCVFPAEPPGNPDSATASALGADSTPFTSIIAAEGSFSFTRGDGNPSNVPFDGALVTMGTATWFPSCVPDGLGGTTCTPVSPAGQTVLLHINDTDECNNLYPTGNTSTCWVYPSPLSCVGDTCNNPPPPNCNGNPACKSAVITDADGNQFGEVDDQGYVIVPVNTHLFINYSYQLINQPTNTLNMVFKYPPSKTDVNNGGFKDYFGCEQTPVTGGSPGGWGTFYSNAPDGALTWTTPFTTNGWQLNFNQTGGTCNQSRFFGTPYKANVVLAPGDSLSFDINMQTRQNKSKKFEYTSCGLHLLNSGFTVKWFPQDPLTGKLGTLQSFSTSITPIYVDVQGCN
jgi:hypothetical protein